MNKVEKKLAKKLIAMYKGQQESVSNFTRDEELILERWRVHKIINEDAFMDVTASTSDHKEYWYSRGYPFTSTGDEERKKGWYFEFRDSKGIKITRDVFTFIAFFTSLFAVIYGFFKK